MVEYIEREAAIATVFTANALGNSAYRDVYDTTKRLRLIPTSDVMPVRHGRWLSMDSEKVITMDEYGCPVDSCRCSECGDWLIGSDEYSVRGRYCPNCGAIMDLEDKE